MKHRIRNRAISIVLALSMVFGVAVPATTPQAEAIIGPVISVGLKLCTSIVKGCVKTCKNADNYKNAGQAALGVFKNAADDLLGTSFGDGSGSSGGDTPSQQPVIVNQVDLSEVEATLKTINTTLEKQNASIYQLESTVTNGIADLSKQMDALSQQITDSTKRLEYNNYLDTFFEFFNQYYEGLSYYDELVTSMLSEDADAAYQKNVFDRFYHLEDVEYSGNFHSSVDKMGRYLQGNYVASSPGSITDVLSQYYILAYKGAGKSDSEARKLAAADTEDMIGYIYYAYTMGAYYEQVLGVYQTACIEESGTYYSTDFGTKLTQGQIDSTLKKLWKAVETTAGSIVTDMRNNYYKDATMNIVYQTPSGDILNRTVPVSGFTAEYGASFWLNDPADDLAQYFSADFCNAFNGLAAYKETHRFSVNGSHIYIKKPIKGEISEIIQPEETHYLSIEYGEKSTDSMAIKLYASGVNGPFAGGMGTEEYPYLIKTTDQFLAISQTDPATGKPYGEGKNYFTLLNDLDFGGASISPINRFSGTFDGNGCTIKNAVIPDAYTPSNSIDLHQGLFGIVYGTVKKLAVSNIKISNSWALASKKDANMYVGVLAGLVYDGSIEYCQVSDCTMNVSFNAESDTGSVYAGGIAGNVSGTLNGVTCIRPQIEAGNLAVSPTSSIVPSAYVGGLAGLASNTGTITRCGVYEASKLCAKSYTQAIAGGLFGRSNCNNITGNWMSLETKPVAEPWIASYPMSQDKLLAGAVVGLGSFNGSLYYSVSDDVNKMNTIGSTQGLLSQTSLPNMKKADYIGKSEIQAFFDGLNLDISSLVHETDKLIPGIGADSFDAASEFTAPTTRTYTTGEYLNLTGMKVYQYVGSNKLSNFMPGISLSENGSAVDLSAPLTVGTHNITVTMPNGATTSFEVKVANKQHVYVTKDTKAATCTDAGTATLTCVDCGDVQTNQTMPALGHTHSITKGYAATCTKDGLTDGDVCSVCGEVFAEQTVIPKTEHQTQTTVILEPTCVASGIKQTKCTECGEVVKTENLKPTGHDYQDTVTKPTCDTPGFTTHTCSICKASYTDSYTAPIEHSYDNGTVTKPATCTEQGEMTYTCTVCKKSYTAPIAKTAHDYVAVVTAPTCDEAGHTTYTCSVCGDSYTADYVSPIGHHYDNGTVTKPATCTEQGEMTYTCSCGETHIEPIAVIPHDYKDKVTDPTCTEMGYTTHTCSVCGDSFKDTYTLPDGHHYGDAKTVTEPTMISTGLMQQTCSVCKETQDITIPCITKCSGIDCPTSNFIDVPVASNWAHIGIDYVIKHNLFNGTAKNEFSPNLSMTRAMLVTVLYRMEGRPSTDGAVNSFRDVPSGKWYTDAVIWANRNNLVNGVSTSEFQPNVNITREQVAAILYRYAKFKGYDISASADLSAFPDSASISNYAKTALSWANAKGLITGSANNDTVLILPNSEATRAQLAAILLRFAQVVSAQ